MRLLVALALAGLLVPVSGCFTCQPQLDVHRCRDTTGRCVAAADGTNPPVQWSADLQGVFPDLDRLMASTPPGKHGHAAWSAADADGFWAFFQVPDGPERSVFLQTNATGVPPDALFQVRVLAC